MGIAETFADYKPVKLTIGKPHPDAVVESTSLASVEPVDITYELSLPQRTIDKGKLSALQLESIVYASQAHENILPDGSRAGFLIGMVFGDSTFFIHFQINQVSHSFYNQSICFQFFHGNCVFLLKQVTVPVSEKV